MSEVGDPSVLAHLELARTQYGDAGVIKFIREVVTETWRANRERWSPKAHFDDTNTLGYQTSRNVTNRMLSTVGDSDVAPSVHVETELGVVVLHLSGLRLRVVKAPIEAGIVPDFGADFDWSTSATREAAARRNSNSYFPLDGAELSFTFETDPRPTHRRRVDRCRDLFLIWAADLTADGTTGWLGLPRLGDEPWMGTLPLWSDDEEPTTVEAERREVDPYVVADEDEDED